MKAKKAVKKNCVARNTYNAKVRKFASINAKTFDDMEKFVKDNCKVRNERERDRVMDELCILVDRMSHLNLDALMWCNKHGIDHDEFVCDIDNRTCDFH